MKNSNILNVIMVLCAVSVSACNHTADQQARSYDEMPVASMDLIQDDMWVNYPEGHSKPYLTDRVHVERVLEDLRLNQVDSISVTANSKERLDSLTRLVIEQTALPVHGQIDETAGDKGRIRVAHWKAHVPNCPDWQKAHGTDTANAYGTNFGCATESNLAMMVVNPHDLRTGRQMGAADSHQTIGAVVRYRNDEVRELRRDDVSLSGN